MDVTIASDPANIAGVRHAIEALAAEVGLDEREVGEVGLCVNEALANVMRHAYGGAADKPIVVRAWCEAGALAVTLRDWGNGVNPECLPAKPYDPCEPGGLGLICLERLMTTAKFVPQADGMLLAMTKAHGQPSTKRPGCGDDPCGPNSRRSERGQ